MNQEVSMRKIANGLIFIYENKEFYFKEVEDFLKHFKLDGYSKAIATFFDEDDNVIEEKSHNLR